MKRLQEKKERERKAQAARQAMFNNYRNSNLSFAEATGSSRPSKNKQSPSHPKGRDTQTPLPGDITNLINFKNYLRRRWQRNKYNFFDYQLKSEINCITKIIKDRFKIHTKTYWENTLKAVKLDSKTFRNVKKFAGTFKRDKNPPLLPHGSTLRAYSDLDKANLLGKYFESIHKKNLNIGSAAET